MISIRTWSLIVLSEDLSAADRLDVGQKISFQLQDTYEQLLQYSPQVLLPAMSGLLMSRLRISPERIRHLTLGKEHGSLKDAHSSTPIVSVRLGRTTVSFQLHELPTQIPTNEQIIHNLRQLIHHQQLNLVDPNRSILHTVDGSVVVGRKKTSVVSLFERLRVSVLF